MASLILTQQSKSYGDGSSSLMNVWRETFELSGFQQVGICLYHLPFWNNMVFFVFRRVDGDGKYLRAMRLASGFFASLPAFKLSEHPEAFQLTTSLNWPWFYLRSKQLFLHFQDSIHLVTKWRNRLLSSSAQLRFGQQSISIEHLHDIIRNDDYSKLDHGLTTTDVNPKDRQNYGSCAWIASDDVLGLLVEDAETYGTFLYLFMLKMIITTYVDKSTILSERMPLPFFSKYDHLFRDALHPLRIFSRFEVGVVPSFHLPSLVDMDSAYQFCIHKSDDNTEK